MPSMPLMNAAPYARRALASLGSALSLAFALGAASIVTGCGTPSTSPGTSQSALTSSSTDDGGLAATATPCLTTFAECIRAGTDDKTCDDALRACLPPPPGDPHDGGPGCDKGGRGPGPGGDPPPRRDDADGGDPGGDHDGDHDGAPPGPPPDADGGAPPPGPRGCIGALVQCAKGTDSVDSCVSTAVTCLESAPPGPPPRGDRR